jgi:hypothetical protein
MTIEVLGYLDQIRRGETSLVVASIPFLAGCLAFWVLTRLAPALRTIGRATPLWGGLIGALAGLALTSIVYLCDTCTPTTAGCRVLAVGVPFRQQTRETDPEQVQWYDGCRAASENSMLASVGNFSLGAFGVPSLLLLGVVARQRMRPEVKHDVGVLEMSRSSPPPEHLFSQAVARLRPILERLGYILVLQRYDEAAFGSAYAEYRGERGLLRVVWDGRDQALWAETRETDHGDWWDAESAAGGDRPSIDRAQDEARLERLARAIEIVSKRHPTQG